MRHEPTTAAEWEARLRSDGATEKDRIAYQRWLLSDPAHSASAARLEELWEATGALRNDALVHEILASATTADRLRQTLALKLSAAAAAALALTIAGWALWFWSFAGDRYETARGEQQVVDLSDGSRLRLNATTRLEVALRGPERRVRLEHGQAFFEVAPDPDRPFVVTAGDKKITVVGTRFDVRLEGGEARVTVLEGKVAVSSTLDPSPERAAKEDPTEPTDATPWPQASEPLAEDVNVALVAGDAVSFKPGAPPSPLDGPEAIATVEAWLGGKVLFDSTPLWQALLELNRYTPIGLRLESPDLGTLKVSGVFYVERLQNLDSLVFALENSLPISVARQDGDLLLRASETTQ